MTLSGRHVVVVGATGDIGSALCRELAARGALLTLVARTEHTLHALAHRLPGADWVSADVTDAASIGAALGFAAERGPVDAVVASAGRDLSGPVEASDPEAVRGAVELNVLGTWFTVRAALPVLRDTHGYLLVNSSLASALPSAPIAGYAMTKAAVSAIARGARREARCAGVTVGLAEIAFVESTLQRRMTAGAMESMSQRFLRAVPVLPVEHVARAFADAIEHRRRHLVLPSYAWPVTLAPPLFLPLLERTLLPMRTLRAGLDRQREESRLPAGR